MAVALSALLITPDAFAQMRMGAYYDDVLPFEVEVSIAPLFGKKAVDPGFLGRIEGRFNVPDSPVDIGMSISCGTYVRNHSEEVKGRVNYLPVVAFNMDYNSRSWLNVAPYVGLGLGGALIKDPISSPDMTISKIALIPRVGFELFNHLRIGLEYDCMFSKYSFAALNVGIVFGGGYGERGDRHRHDRGGRYYR